MKKNILKLRDKKIIKSFTISFVSILSIILLNLIILLIFPSVNLLNIIKNIYQILILKINKATLIPSLGLCISIIKDFYLQCNNRFNNKEHIQNRRINSIFIATGSIFTISAYVMWIQAANTMAIALSPLVASLFVAATSLSLLQESWYAWKCYNSYKSINLAVPEKKNCMKKNTKVNNNITLREKNSIAYQLDKFSYKQHIKNTYVNLLSAIIMIIIMTIWCFSPINIKVTIFACISLSLNFIISYLLKNYNKNKMHRQLNRALAKIKSG